MTRPAAKPLGKGKCPCCSEQAAYSESKTGRVVITCMHCRFQGFARAGISDAKLRSLLTEAAPAAPNPKPEVAPASTPKTQTQTEPAEQTRRGWGLLG